MTIFSGDQKPFFFFKGKDFDLPKTLGLIREIS